jgi:hypothetical protein
VNNTGGNHEGEQQQGRHPAAIQIELRTKLTHISVSLTAKHRTCVPAAAKLTCLALSDQVTPR